MTAAYPQDWLNIVVLDDDPTYRAYIAALLAKRERNIVQVASSYEEIAAFLLPGCIDCIILDYDLGDENGFSIRQKLSSVFSNLPPVILLTGDESTAIKALREGISDFLPKRSLTPQSLFASVAEAIETHKNDQRMRAELDRLSKASTRDPLTGLASQAFLAAELSRSATIGISTKGGAIFAVEIDNFVSIAKTFGPATSDRILQLFAQRLRALLKPSEVAGRGLRGTVLIIDHTNEAAAEAETRCSRLAAALSFRADLPSVGLDLTVTVRRVSVDQAKALISEDMGSVPSEPLRASSDPPVKMALRCEDRRREPRTRVLKRGQIIVAGLATIDCMVRNVSNHGAGLRLDAPFVPPAHFKLSIAGAEKIHAVEVRWQAGRDLGVLFLD